MIANINKSLWLGAVSVLTALLLFGCTAFKGDINAHAGSPSDTQTKNDADTQNNAVQRAIRDALSTWAGSTNITTIGTITTGVFHGTPIADEYIASASRWNSTGTSNVSQPSINTKVDKTTTVNGQPLSSNVTVTASDVGLGNVTNNAQVTSVTASSPLSSSGGTTPNITVSTASSNSSGTLTSTDWNTFNGKQANLGYVPVQTVSGSGQINSTGGQNPTISMSALSSGNVTTALGYTPANSADFSGVSAYNSADESIPSGVWTSVTFNSENYKNNPIYHSTSANTANFIVPTSGVYLMMGQFYWGATNTFLSARIYDATTSTVVNLNRGFPNGLQGFVNTVTGLAYLNAGDIINLQAEQESGSSVSIFSLPTWSPGFSMQRVGN